jgi:hypothetical protein
MVFPVFKKCETVASKESKQREASALGVMQGSGRQGKSLKLR